jgi:integrase/recombinase XerD
MHAVEHVEDMTRAHVKDWQTWLWKRTHPHTHKPLADSTRLSHLTSVRQLCHFLLRRKILFLDPSAVLDTPRTKRPLPRNIPTIAEMENILARPDTGTLLGLRDKALLETAYSTGLRRRELADLNLYDINLTDRTIHVRRGKGGHARMTPLTETACHVLTRYIKESRARLIQRKNPRRLGHSDGALWITWTGERLRVNALGARVARYVRRIRPGTRAACHAIRHAFATHMLQGGAHIRLLQNMLGHARITSTEIYTHVKPIDLKAMHKKHHPRGLLE